MLCAIKISEGMKSLLFKQSTCVTDRKRLSGNNAPSLVIQFSIMAERKFLLVKYFFVVIIRFTVLSSVVIIVTNITALSLLTIL